MAVSWTQALQAEVPDDVFLRKWLICGPFPNPPNTEKPAPGRKPRSTCLDTDYLTEHGGESKIVPVPGMTHTKKDGTKVAWFEHDSPEWKVVFRKAITKQADVVGYAYGVITVDKAGRYLMTLGSDEGVCVWVNGEQVHYNFVKRVIRKDDELVPVSLKKGENRVLVKVEQRKGGWGFAMRLLPEDEVLSSMDTDAGRFVIATSLRMHASDIRKKVELHANGKMVASAPLVTTHDGAVANASLEIPFPPAGEEHEYKTVDVVVHGEILDVLEMPLVDKIRVEEFRWRTPRGYPGCVFAGEELPRMDFDRRASIEKLIGPYALSTTFYDADYNQVTKAEKPGRYGAVVDIKTASTTTRRFVTLYRQEKDIDWWRHELNGSVILPEELGVLPGIAKEYAEHVNGFLKGRLAEGLRRDPGGAVLLAALHEAEADGVKSGFYSSPGIRDRAWWLPLKRRLYGADKEYPDPFVCPTKLDGLPTRVVRKGSLREAGMKKGFAKRMDKHLKAWAADTDEAFAVAIVRHGVIAFHKAYGTRDGKPMTVNTKSWMASTTKMMSATLIMMLVDQGLLSLDDRADKYLPPLRHPDTEWPATIRNLYMHTAGLRGHWGSWMSDMEYRVAEKIPYYTVEKQCAYDGAGLEVSCKVLEIISGETLPEFYQDHLFRPLGIENTHAGDACGGSRSVPLDMAKIGQMLLQKGSYGDMRFFSEDTLEQMLPRKEEDRKSDVGAGYGIGTTYFTHDGLGKGTFAHGAASSAFTRIDPEHDLVISMTRNAMGTNFGKYHSDFVKIILESME